MPVNLIITPNVLKEMSITHIMYSATMNTTRCTRGVQVVFLEQECDLVVVLV